MLPYCWSHFTEFFPASSQLVDPYEGKLQGLEMAYGLHVHDLDHERARVNKWERLVETWSSEGGSDVSLNVLPSAELVEVVKIIEALLTNGHDLFGVNVPNRGAIDNLPDDAIVEVTSLVDGYGTLPEPLAAMLCNHVAARRLTAQAALTGDYHLARQAFIQDPQTQARLALEDIGKLMEALFVAHQEHLPQFS